MAKADTDLEEAMSHLGEFGKYQRGQFLLHILASMTAGIHMLSLITVAAVPAFTCNVPNSNENSHLPGAISGCYYMDTNNVTHPCTSWTYDSTYFKSSRAIEWNMVCSKRWMGSVAQSSYMFGVFIGAVTLGSLADTYGRRKIFNISGAGQLILGVAVAFIPEYYTFLVFRFFYGIFGSAGAYITGFVLSMELVGASKRTRCGVVFQVTFAIGFMLLAFWGMMIQNRMWLQVIYGMHSLLLVVHWWLMDESPRWLWTQNRIPEAIAIIQKGLRINNSPVILSAQKYVSKHKVEDKKDTKSYGIIDLFKTRKLRNKTLNICFNWFANSIVYYGLSLNTGNLVGNPYLMMFLCGLVEIPSYIFVILVLDRTGRRSLISTLMIVGGISCIIATAIPKDLPGGTNAVTTIVLIGKACIAGSFAIIYNYTAELFPTVVRNSAIGIGSMCARLSGALTPMIMLLDSFNPKIPATFFGIFSMLAGFLSLFLPETVNKPMLETLEDAM